MKFLKIFALIVGLALYSSLVKAETGCEVNGEIFSPRTGTALLGAYISIIPLSVNLGITVDVYVSPRLSIVPNTCPGWISNKNYTGNKCATETLLGAGLLSLYLLATNEGREVSYQFIQCPLDDYIPFMLLAVGASGFFFIRKHSSLLGAKSL